MTWMTREIVSNHKILFKILKIYNNQVLCSKFETNRKPSEYNYRSEIAQDQLFL